MNVAAHLKGKPLPLLLFGLAAAGIVAAGQPSLRTYQPAPLVPPTPRAVPSLAAPSASAMVQLTVRAVQSAMREPDSFEALAANSNAAGTDICIRYRARNGFGGMSVEAVRVTRGQLHRITGRQWDRQCMGKGWRGWPV